MAYIPFYTKYKALQEELKGKEEELKTEKLVNADLRDENFDKKMIIEKLKGTLIEIDQETKKQNYGSSKNLGNKIQTMIYDKLKELDVAKLY